MRWRLYIFFLSATAAFCFMLLTAVTDYGSGTKTADQSNASLVSVALATLETAPSAPVKLSSVARIAPPASVSQPSAPAAFDSFLKPNAPKLFIPRDADPVMERHEADREERANRGKPAHRKRLKWDEAGWYREEVAMVTAYCPCSKCCGSIAAGITSIGKDAWSSGLAADPVYLDYGTRVMVPGYGLSEIDDTGGAMRRHWRQNGLLHIDVRMTYHYEARQWGKQYLRVKIYAE